MSATIISVTNNKGGVGKTTSVINISTLLKMKYNKKVLLVDLDQQCNLSQTVLGISSFEGDIKNSGELFNLKSPYKTKELIKQSKYGVDIIPGKIDDLFLMEQELENIYDVIDQSVSDIKKNNILGAQEQLEEIQKHKMSWMKILKKKISEVINDYDYIFYDLPPSVSRIPKNAWVSSDYLLIPISDYYALSGTQSLLDKMIEIKKEHNENLKFIFFFNKIQVTSNKYKKDVLGKGYDRMIKSFLNAIGENQFLSQCSYIMEAGIRYSTAFEKLHEKDNLLAFDPIHSSSKILQDYHMFIEELHNYLQ